MRNRFDMQFITFAKTVMNDKNHLHLEIQNPDSLRPAGLQNYNII